MRFLLGVSLALAVAATPSVAAVPAAPAVHSLQFHTEADMPVYGSFKVFFKSGARPWKLAGELGFDNYYRQRTLDLSGIVPSDAPVRLRLVQVGGGASQLDEVRLGGQSPMDLSATMAKKLAAADRDVMVASGKTFEFAFAPVASPVLTLGARVEAPKIPHLQFNLPEVNRLRGPETGWSFMPYSLGSQPLRLKTDGALDEVQGLQPFLHEIRTSATGHGFGDVYAWVGDDADHLYVAFDFTIDNTVEDDFYPGADDYAKVYIRYGPAKTDLQEFKLRVRDSTWGKTGFAYTDKVGYEHRTYEFKIPRRNIKALAAPAVRNVELAFGLFGSASDGDFPVRMTYAPGLQRYLAVSGYSQSYSAGEYVHARVLGADGAPLGSPIVVTGPTYSYASNAYSFDGVWDPQTNRFVVVWERSDGTLHGRTLSPAGVSGPTFALATGLGTNIGDLDVARGGNATWPFLAAMRNNTDGSLYVLPFNASGVTAGSLTAVPRHTAGWAIGMQLVAAADGSYLLVWYESDNIYAAHVGADGALFGSTVTVYDSATYELAPTVAFDPERNRFLIAWRSDANENVSAALFYPADNTAGAVFTLFDPGTTLRYPRPALDWDPVRKQFSLVMHLTNEPVPFRYAEINPADMRFAYGPVTTAALSKDNVSPSLAAAGDSGAMLLGWQTYLNGVCCVYDYAVAVTNLPAATLSASAFDFGTLTQSTTSASRELVVTNNGAARSLMAVNATIEGPFAIATNGCTGSLLAKGAACSLFVTAAPTATGAQAGTLRLTGGLAKNVTLKVEGAVDGVPDLRLTDPAPPATDGELVFGFVTSGTQLVRKVTVSNEGTADLVLGTLAEPKHGAGFTLDAKACNAKTLAPGEACEITVTFAPVANQEYEASVEIASNDPDGATTLSLRGTGVPTGGVAELTAPVLVLPVDGAAEVAVPAELAYRPALAADGGAVAHTVFVCADATFVNCEGDTVAAAAPLGGRWGWLMFGAGALGFVFVRRKAGVVALLLAGLMFVSCGDNTNKANSQPGLVTYVAEKLEAKTVYYWKVVAEDQAGHVTQSDVRSFTTK